MRVVDMSQGTSQRLSSDRKLLSSSDPVERLKFIRSKQWIQGAPAYSPHRREARVYSGPPHDGQHAVRAG